MKKLLNLLLILPEYFLDFIRALKWSKASPICPKQNRIYYDIIILAHTVEKGLSVLNPRMQFGVAKITELLNLIDKYDWKTDPFPVEKSYGCLKSYLELHKNNDFDLGNFGKRIQLFVDDCISHNITPKGGVKTINSMDDINDSHLPQLLNRSSSRRYIDKVVSHDLIDKIVLAALRTPSQCNRQSTRVHHFSDKNKIQELLTIQAGANEFKDKVPNLFIITSEMSAWSGFKARSQAYVDGSLVAMQVMNACQSLGLDYCPLNLAVSNLKELRIAKVAGISTGERLIMMISFGFPVEGEKVVARSERISPNRLLISH